MTIFINGKQKRVERPPSIDGMDVDEFIRRNADTIWSHQNEMWEHMDGFQEKATEEYGQYPCNAVKIKRDSAYFRDSQIMHC